MHVLMVVTMNPKGFYILIKSIGGVRFFITYPSLVVSIRSRIIGARSMLLIAPYRSTK